MILKSVALVIALSVLLPCGGVFAEREPLQARHPVIVPADPGFQALNQAAVSHVLAGPVEMKPWDINQDGMVDLEHDLLAVLNDFGKKGGNLQADVDPNGVVDIMDIVLVAGHLPQETATAIAHSPMQAQAPAPWDINQDFKVDILDLVFVAQRFGTANFAGVEDVNGDRAVDIVDLVLVAQHFGEEIEQPAVPVGIAGIGDFRGNAIGPFGGASAVNGRTPDGAVTVELKLVRNAGFASWGYDFASSVNVKDNMLVIYVKGPEGAQMRLQFRDQAWHDAGRFGQVQARSGNITFAGDWQKVEIDLSKITGNGIDFSRLKHIAVEFGLAEFNNNPGITLQVGDPADSNKPAFSFFEKQTIPQMPANLTPEAVANWLNNLAAQSRTGVPFSFQVPPEIAASLWPNTTNEHERMVLKEGLVIYDGALAEILWSLMGDSKRAGMLTNAIWKGNLGQLELRAYHREGDDSHPFIYSDDPNDISGFEEGKRGFVFKTTNANGVFNVIDPLTGRQLDWSQWQPIAGENAWAGVIAPLQAYAKKYGDTLNQDAVELKLAEEIARAAMFLQAENGGIRMGPQGIWHDSGDTHWYYNEQSVENNLSWYSAFRMLHQVTGDQKYKDAMTRLEGFFKSAFDPMNGTFAQGFHFNGTRWNKNVTFATDVQTWGVLALGAEWIDARFGAGAAFRMLESAKKEAGVFDSKTGALRGVDFTNYRNLGRAPMVSVEWTAGAIMAFQQAAQYYAVSNPVFSQGLTKDADSMWDYTKSLAVDINGTTAYPYATGSGPTQNRPTGHGWFAPPQEVMSTASSVWMALLELGFNPFELGGK
ncbi:MAG: hypothetical protein HYS56_00655 [Candidatus Omnitrophica bacterium]|nr:hypothetical protein [Candidatus Omnitrophota bacterium]